MCISEFDGLSAFFVYTVVCIGRDRPVPRGVLKRPGVGAPEPGCLRRENPCRTTNPTRLRVSIPGPSARSSSPLTVLTPEHTPVDDDETTIVSVVSHSGESYEVDAREGRCTCPDARHRDPEGGCKHVRRARVAVGREPVDARTIRAVEVDPQLGENAPGPRVATSDGGIIDAGDDAEVLDESGGDDRPEACECADFHADATLPCWPCYRDGFDIPNPSAGED